MDKNTQFCEFVQEQQAQREEQQKQEKQATCNCQTREDMQDCPYCCSNTGVNFLSARNN